MKRLERIVIQAGMLGTTIVFWLVCMKAILYGGSTAKIILYFNHWNEGIAELVILTFFVYAGSVLVIRETNPNEKDVKRK